MAGGRGHPDRARRHDQPRGAGRPGRWARCASSAAARCDIDYDDRRDAHRRRPQVLREGDAISIDGFSRRGVLGRSDQAVEVVRVLRRQDRSSPRRRRSTEHYAQLMKWADKFRSLRRAHQRRPAGPGASCARAFGAEGIGLCRTEHMFFGEGEDRPDARDDPGATTSKGARARARQAAAAAARATSRASSARWTGKPVTIRPLDPPLHEFLPHDEADQRELAERDGHHLPSSVHAQRRALHEFNPDARASAAAASASSIRRSPRCRRAPSSRRLRNVRSARASKVEPEIMIPLVGHVKELTHQASDRATRRGRGACERDGHQVPLPGRHHDRGAARRAHGRRDRPPWPSSSRSAPTT